MLALIKSICELCNMPQSRLECQEENPSILAFSPVSRITSIKIEKYDNFLVFGYVLAQMKVTYL